LIAFRSAKQRGTKRQSLSAEIATRDAKQQKCSEDKTRKPGEMTEEQCARRRKTATELAMASAFALSELMGR